MLVAPRNPLNIGAVARAIGNFGFSDLRVVNPYEVAFREARSAVGAAEVLATAREFNSVADAIADSTLVMGTTAIGHRQPMHPVYMLHQGVLRIRERLVSGCVAILFGSEKFGLSNEDLSYCNCLLHIPTHREHLSMNLGQAVAVCLYEIIRGADVVPAPTESRLAAGEDVNRLTELLVECSRRSGYLPPSESSASEQKLRRLVRRLSIPADDAPTWLGIFRQLLWKLRGQK